MNLKSAAAARNQLGMIMKKVASQHRMKETANDERSYRDQPHRQPRLQRREGICVCESSRKIDGSDEVGITHVRDRTRVAAAVQ
ncbi:hypothetical protein MPTK1_4g02360 [Marchantia polymorpha subsp. ruderalis]|uniref:Uncharacterized protein n=2 Tax=Marchantia polymorpha TaxID=3197 RepID=A0AAF6B5H3_MARPO|nr:hypothetical protein MARPO_0080s0062 [Marchantia polymorpha]BBN07257.1 hypothetical protein Mp_4g02360 [Marchantia polymorpha subsp. ruderalis]|eukprot:PTQ34446.1 hypothetical protein MARPO_0080s0062 [Marchantia polymorpha]